MLQAHQSALSQQRRGPAPAVRGAQLLPSRALIGAWRSPSSVPHRLAPHRGKDSFAPNSSSGQQALQPEPEQSHQPGTGPGWTLWVGLAAVIAAGAFVMATPQGTAWKAFLVNGPLGKSGFLAAFSLIFLSEIGDKTFFIAALLAMKLGKWISFAGSLSSLSIMTVISVAIGAIFSKVPDALRSSLPVGELAGIALLFFFGVRALRDGLKAEPVDAADEEQAEAEEEVKRAETSGRMRRNSPVKAFFEVASLIFIAEWGDRSMLATIALGAAQNPVGVATGAIVGHALATGIAVVGGAIASRYVSEKTINITSGVLFLLFAAATTWSMF